MARYRNKMGNDNYVDAGSPDERYNLAYKRVKRIKGFYIHLLIFIFVNAFIIISNSNESIPSNHLFWSWENFSTALFWGIGLTFHGLSVFGRNLFFSKDWEEKKIHELMEKEKNDKWE